MKSGETVRVLLPHWESLVTKDFNSFNYEVLFAGVISYSESFDFLRLLGIEKEFFTAFILTCLSRKSTGGADITNDGCSPCVCVCVCVCVY